MLWREKTPVIEAKIKPKRNEQEISESVFTGILLRHGMGAGLVRDAGCLEEGKPIPFSMGYR